MKFGFFRHCNKNVPPSCVKDDQIPSTDPNLQAIQNGTMPTGLVFTDWASSTNTWCNDCNELGYTNAIQWKDAFLQLTVASTNVQLYAAAYKSHLHPNCSASRRMVENLWPYSVAIHQPIQTLFCDTDISSASQYFYSLWTQYGSTPTPPWIFICWEHLHIPPLVDAFLNSFPPSIPIVGKHPSKWNGSDFNSLWLFDVQPNQIVFTLTSRTKILGLPDPETDRSSSVCTLL